MCLSPVHFFVTAIRLGFFNCVHHDTLSHSRLGQPFLLQNNKHEQVEIGVIMRGKEVEETEREGQVGKGYRGGIR